MDLNENKLMKESAGSFINRFLLILSVKCNIEIAFVGERYFLLTMFLVNKCTFKI